MPYLNGKEFKFKCSDCFFCKLLCDLFLSFYVSFVKSHGSGFKFT